MKNVKYILTVISLLSCVSVTLLFFVFWAITPNYTFELFYITHGKLAFWTCTIFYLSACINILIKTKK